VAKAVLFARLFSFERSVHALQSLAHVTFDFPEVAIGEIGAWHGKGWDFRP
jgi:hypothetical protein